MTDLTSSGPHSSKDTLKCLLGEHELSHFTEQGYLVLPGFLPEDLLARLKPEVDRWVDEGHRTRSIASCTDPQKYGTPPIMELELEAHGELLAYQPLMEIMAQLMGSFVFHHLHSDRQAPETPGKSWHHDYEQNPQSDRTHLMIHTLHYLDGLDNETSALAILPGSHAQVAEKKARDHLGTDEIPDEIVLEDLPAGSTVVLHSALFHARRARADQQGKPRYMVDTSYCQTGVAWQPVKPYWRDMLKRGRELELDRGQWPELFAEQHFSEYTKAG